MTTKLEFRNDMRLESVKQNADGSLFVKGYVNETNSWSKVLGTTTKFVEKIMPGAFERALKRAKNVEFLYEHDNKQILSDMKSGNLTLKEDERGLYMEAKIFPTTWGKNAFELIKSGVVNKMSFGFRKIKDEVKKGANGIYERVVQDLELFEVSAVRNPAYDHSSLSARSITVIENLEIREDVQNMNIKELKAERVALAKQGKELEKTAKTENRSLSDFEKVEVQDLKERIDEIDVQLNVLKAEEERNIIEIPEDTSEEVSADYRAMEQFIQGLKTEETRNLTTNSETGAVLVPTTISEHIVKQVFHDAKLFSLAKNIPAVEGKAEYLREKTLGNAGFVGEMQNINLSDFSMDKILLGQKRVGTAIEFSDKVVNESGIKPLEYGMGMLQRRLSYFMDSQVLHGDYAGNTSIQGIIGNPLLESIESEKNVIAFDDLWNVLTAMHPDYAENGVWVMHWKTFAKLLKLKDKTGANLILRDKLTDAPILKILEQPVLLCDAMDEIGTGKTPILFANFGEGYARTEKKALHLQHIWKDRQSRSKRRHLLILDQYIDGKIVQPEAFKQLKMKA